MPLPILRRAFGGMAPTPTSLTPSRIWGALAKYILAGVSTYNSLQAKVEKRYSHGLSFLATYTWSHALDDASDAGGLFSAIGNRQPALIPYIDELTNSVFDIRNRFTINGNYELPFGQAGRSSAILLAGSMRLLVGGLQA